MNLKEFVLIQERQLGLMLDPSIPEWKAKSVQASILRKKMESNPKLYTWENLTLTAEWMRHRRMTVTNAATICSFVERALRDQGDDGAASDKLSLKIQKAIAYEMSIGDPDGWLSPLTRSFGTARGEVLAEWRAARGFEGPQ